MDERYDYLAGLPRRALFVRLSCCPPHLGGFRNEADCKKAWSLLAALVSRVGMELRFWVMPDPGVVLDKVLQPQGECPVAISLSAGLQCDLSSLLEVVWHEVEEPRVGNGARRAAGPRDSLLHRLRMAFPRSSSAHLPLLDLFKLAARVKSLECLLKQFVWHVFAGLVSLA